MRHMDDLYKELGELAGLDEMQASNDRNVLAKAIEVIKTRNAEISALLGILGDTRAALAVPDEMNIIHYARELRAKVDALEAQPVVVLRAERLDGGE